MVRVILVCMGLFAVPFLVYALMQFLRDQDSWNKDFWAKAPVFLLTAIGAVLVFGLLIYFGQVGGVGTEGTYHPPSFKDGKVDPAHIDQVK